EHARLDRQFTTVLQRRNPVSICLESVGWSQRTRKGRSAVHEIIEAKFGKEGAFQIAVARWMKIIEQRILTSPERPVSWRMQLHLGQPESPTEDIIEWPTSVAVQGFLDARSAYFSRVLQG